VSEDTDDDAAMKHYRVPFQKYVEDLFEAYRQNADDQAAGAERLFNAEIKAVRDFHAAALAATERLTDEKINAVVATAKAEYINNKQAREIAAEIVRDKFMEVDKEEKRVDARFRSLENFQSNMVGRAAVLAMIAAGIIAYIVSTITR
jgi:GTPase Era involved in 16S rRNA processing